ncbi:tetraacyldisaccharide 4'-kinase [Sphingobacterium hungaricum]|uniref:Tetraacyldisaccharide 4'-kinase n=1 Tax=Sphingobacterium hungaricum TaxID=2082723 RepID=A0A928YR35_9SPHI|nr:tetraacyldisaccharide 4'-kinase [Sphingobacterium hungaricum]MBE8712948.1 tetraacyldisaccharide 4'-kinase [Sphingobacterium hungaricum]
MAALRWLLLPFSALYASILWIRNKLYDIQLFKSREFAIPTIVVGNLVVGGAGKSPMVEYLISLLKDSKKVATLSRGYGRKTKGFALVHTASTADEVGDEPLQFKRKFPEITVAVCEDRCFGVEQLEQNHDVIILDDAFQHRKLKPKFSILLFDFESLLSFGMPLPTGNFRDLMSQTRRADCIVITKCPSAISENEKRKIEHKIKRYSNSPIFYSKISYLPIHSAKRNVLETDLSNTSILLFTGIANPKPLLEYLTPISKSVEHVRFSDHHAFEESDFDKIKKAFDSLANPEKIILTTEKDFQRIPSSVFSQFPLYIQPIQQALEHANHFDELINKAL